MFLSGLSPFGPIFGKELRTAARRRRNYFLRVAYLLGLLLFLLLAWSITRSEYGRGGVAQRTQQQEQLGWMFFGFFSMFCVGAMGLIGPVLTSTAINGERQAKTLHVLLMTPLTAWQIVSGKLFSRMLTALTLIGLSLPVLALVRLLGGVELEQMFAVICLCAVVAMFGAAMGLLFSILIHRAYAVIILSYLLLAFIYLFAPMLTISLWSSTMGRRPWMAMLGTCNPFYAAGVIGWGQARLMGVDWTTCVLIHLAATAVLLFICALLVRRIAHREGESATPMVYIPPPISDPNVVGEPLPIIPSPPTRQRINRTVSDSPVLWRELRRPLMTRTWQRIVAVIACTGLLTLAYIAAGVNDGLKDPGFHAFMACCFYTLMMLLACVISATCITQEKEGESWTVLLASPISGSAIVWGKTLGVLRRLLWPMMLVIVHFAIFSMTGAISPLAALLAIVVIAMFNSIWVATGVALSLRFRKVTAAVITNLALPVALYGAGSVILAVLDAALETHNSLVNQVTWYLPYFYFVEGMSGSVRGHQYTYELPGIHYRVSLPVFALVAIFVGLLHILAAVGLLTWTAARFNAIVGRAPQRDPILAPAAKTAAT